MQWQKRAVGGLAAGSGGDPHWCVAGAGAPQARKSKGSAFCFLHSQARKPTDTFDYCPSTRCKKTTRCNTSFCGFVEGDTEAPRGAVLWRHTEAPRGAVLWRHQRARVLEQEEDTEMRPRSEVAGREGQRGAQGVRGIEFE